MREQDKRWREAINVSRLQKTCIHFAFEYTDKVGYMKMKGLGFFPVNNILQ